MHVLLKLRSVPVAIAIVLRYEEIGVNHLMLDDIKVNEELRDDNYQQSFDEFLPGAKFEEFFAELDDAIAAPVVLAEACTERHAIAPLDLHRRQLAIKVLLIELE